MTAAGFLRDEEVLSDDGKAERRRVDGATRGLLAANCARLSATGLHRWQTGWTDFVVARPADRPLRACLERLAAEGRIALEAVEDAEDDSETTVVLADATLTAWSRRGHAAVDAIDVRRGMRGLPDRVTTFGMGIRRKTTAAEGAGPTRDHHVPEGMLVLDGARAWEDARPALLALATLTGRDGYEVFASGLFNAPYWRSTGGDADPDVEIAVLDHFDAVLMPSDDDDLGGGPLSAMRPASATLRAVAMDRARARAVLEGYLERTRASDAVVAAARALTVKG